MASASSRCRPDFHRQPLASAIFAIGDYDHLLPQFAIGVMVKHTRCRINSPFSNPDRDVGLAPDVLDPAGSFTRFGEQVETLAVDHEPNLNLARQTRGSSDVVR
jgi:hypothetical protein